MPRQTSSPLATDAVDRLILGSEIVRGSEPHSGQCIACCGFWCFDAEPSLALAMVCGCFEAE